MRPTRDTTLPSWMRNATPEDKEDFRLRLHRCVDCDNENYWKDKPLKDGSVAENHKFLYREGWMALSMLSDPIFYPVKRKSRRTK